MSKRPRTKGTAEEKEVTSDPFRRGALKALDVINDLAEEIEPAIARVVGKKSARTFMESVERLIDDEYDRLNAIALKKFIDE
jgi:hypothetical protein